jgi:hypothetical protein
MAATDVHEQETETQRVVRWRAERLERAGYDPAVALELAERPEIDLHHAIRLIEQGCAADVAARILL